MNIYTTKFLSLAIIAIIFSSCSGEGTDNAQLEADISPVIPKVSSSISKIYVSDNQRVSKGDTIVTLDEATFKIAVENAEIALLQAKRNLNLASNNLSSAGIAVSNIRASSGAISAGLEAAESAVSAAKTRYEVAEKNYERYAELLKERSTTQQQFDIINAEKIEAKSRLQTAIGQHNTLLKQIDASKLQVEGSRTQQSNSKENISLSELAVKQAESNLNAAKLQLSYCTLTAPSDGIVSKKSIQIGQVVSVGEPLMAIANDKNVWVVANFKETQMKNLRAGQEAEIEVDAYSDTTFTGKVQSLAQATGAKFSFIPADNATGNFVKVTQRVPVKIVIMGNANGSRALRAGMSVNVHVKTK